MKQTVRKSFCLLLTLVTVLCMSALPVFAESSKGDDAMMAQLEQTGPAVVEQLSQMKAEQLKALKESGDAFNVSVAEAWENSEKELGNLEGVKETEVSFHEGSYTVTVKGDFEKRDAEIVLSFDEKGAPLGLAVNPEYTFGEKMGQAGINTVIGVGTVFIILLLLTFLISLFKHVNLLDPSQRKKEKKIVEPSKAEPIVTLPVEEELADDGELVAVITAAIMAAGAGNSGDGFRVRSIRRISNWKKSER
ncbi:MAG TPA: OadG family transporter subunit [Lachnospiraceae bacterium]